MGTVGWLVVVAVGIALGYGIGRTWPGSAAKMTELQRERDAAREELREYRKDVSTHFERTAALFDKVTADYQGLYEHLALGARRLSAIRGESDDASLAEPELRRLAEPGAAASPAQLEPEGPTAAEEPDTREEAVAADEPGAPEEPIAADQPGAPEEPVAADEPGVPEEPVAADEPGVPEEPAAPEADRPPKDATG